MKKTVIFIVIVTIAIGVIASRSTKPVNQNKIQVQKTDAFSNSPLPTSTPAITPALPNAITIPVINVNATIEQVGLDAERRMDIPKKVLDVGWYSLGVRPGQIGNSVIDGHFDTQTGSAATFYNLKLLKTGNKILVTDVQNKLFTFAVTKLTYYQTATFPTQIVFGPADSANLQLITCAGVWDRLNKNYTERLVVSSTLIPSK